MKPFDPLAELQTLIDCANRLLDAMDFSDCGKCPEPSQYSDADKPETLIRVLDQFADEVESRWNGKNADTVELKRMLERLQQEVYREELRRLQQ